LDEQSASARISRYESGIHKPPVSTARSLAEVLDVPLSYLYCDDDRMAEIILAVAKLPPEDQDSLLQALQARLKPRDPAKT
jgi:transcriptional regulator with XRE-family HTH domain